MLGSICLVSAAMLLGGLAQANSDLQASSRAAASSEPPLSGRPDNFSGAIGTFHVETRANPTTIDADGQLILTVRISGKGNLHEIKRPDLERLPSLARRFRIRNNERRYSANGQAVEFDYSLSPRNANVTQIPPVGFVYYRPKLGYQTSYASSIPIVVRVSPQFVSPPQASRELSNCPSVVYKFPDAKEMLGCDQPLAFPSPLAVITSLLLPPALCLLWIAKWGKRSRWLANGKSQAYRRVARRLSPRSQVGLTSARQILSSYCRDRFGLSTGEPTSEEIIICLERNGIALEDVRRTKEFLERADRARFAGQPDGDAVACSEFKRLFLRLEGDGKQ